MILDISGFDNLRIRYDILKQNLYDEFVNRIIAQLLASQIATVPSILNGLTELEARILSGRIRIYRCDVEDMEC